MPLPLAFIRRIFPIAIRLPFNHERSFLDSAVRLVDRAAGFAVEMRDFRGALEVLVVLFVFAQSVARALDAV